MSEDPTETGETQITRGRKAKTLFPLTAIAVALFSISTFAQTAWSMRRVNEDSSARIIEQMSAEANKYGLKLSRNSLTLHRTERALTIGMQVIGAETANERDWLKGVDIAFVYLESDTRDSLPNGFYTVRLSEIPRRRPRYGDTSKGRNIVASFINSEGRVIKEFPVDGGSSFGDTPQGIFVRQELHGGKWVNVCYFATRFEYWAWFAGPDGPCIAC